MSILYSRAIYDSARSANESLFADNRKSMLLEKASCNVYFCDKNFDIYWESIDGKNIMNISPMM